MQLIQGSSAWFVINDSSHLLFAVSIVGAFTVGMWLSFLLSRPANRHLQHTYPSEPILPLSDGFCQDDTNTDAAYLAQQIKTVIKNLTNSQYVLKDQTPFNSLFQTPLRHSIHQLRVISESLLVGRTTELQRPSITVNDEYCYAEDVIIRQTQLVEKLSSKCKVKFASNHSSLDNVAVAVSEEWLSSAIREVLLNPVKHNKKPIHLSFSSFVTDGFLVVSVVDNGQGMPHAITQRFSQHSTNVSRLYRRKSDCENQMNLTLVQEKLLSIDGKLIITSARNYRTQVQIWVPLLRCSDSAQVNNVSNDASFKVHKLANQADFDTHTCGALTSTLPAAVHSTIPRVLWVSSQKHEYDGLRNNIGQSFMLNVAESVEEALSMVPNYKPDCILMDEDVTVADSLVVKSWMQASDSFSDIPVVVLGGLIDKSSQLSVLQNGLSAVVEKPVIASELKSVITTVVAERNRLSQRVEEAIADYHSNSIDSVDADNSPSDVFFAKFNTVLEQHFHDENFRLAQAADAMNMADKTLSRKITKYYPFKFCDLIKKFRLNKAKTLIMNGERITNVAYDTGFSSPSYFTQCFRAEFGFAPSMLAKKC
jgi:AraC-like DNA-binding protein